MTAQNGKDLLIKIDMTGNGFFETAAGLRATRISFNAESIDVTSLESAGGREKRGHQRVGRVQGRSHRRTRAPDFL